MMQRWGTRAMVVTLVLGIVSGVAATAQAAGTAPRSRPPSPVADHAAGPLQPAQLTADPAERAAVERARVTHRQVEVVAHRSATGTDYAHPDGSLTHVESARPVRVRRDGGWVPADTTLVRGPAGIAPAAATLPVSIADGGIGELAALSGAGWSLRLRWPAPLPRPTLHGDTATYAAVFPGVDLTVTAGDAGFSENLVVRDRRAAADSALRTVTFGLELTGLAATKTSTGWQLRDRTGATVLTVPNPMMWDASSGIGGPGRYAAVGLDLSGGALVLHPDRRMLADPAARFPITIDPSFNASRGAWTIVQSGWPDTSYWNGAYDPADSNGRVMVGRDPYYGDVARGFFRMQTSAINGKHILKATFQSTERWSSSCSARQVELWWTGAISSSVTWNHQPSWNQRLGTVNVAKGNENYGCGDGAVEFDVTSLIRTAAAARWPDATFGLRATDEGDTLAWKRFDDNPSLAIDYNSVPNTPTGLTIEARACGTGTYVGSATPTMRATVSDPDAGQTQTVSLYWAAAGAAISESAKVTQNAVANGGQAVMAIPAGNLADGGDYYFEAKTSDGTDTSALSAACAFSVDTTRPAAPPAVTSTDYPADGNFHGGVGQPGTFTLNAGGVGDVQSYLWGWQDPPTTAVPAATLGADVTIGATPSQVGLNTLYVRTSDRAGNLSDITRYVILVGGPTGPVGQWDADEGSGTMLSDTSGNGHSVTLNTGTGWTTGRAGGGDRAATFNGSSGYGTTAPVLTPTDGFTASAWVRLDRTGTWSAAISQNGSTASSFNLGYSGSQWAFAVHDVDAPSTTVKPVRVYSSLSVVTGVWTHLTGVYDAGTRQVQLYVNGELAGTADNVPTFDSHGSLDIGRSLWDGGWRDWWPGALDSVRVWNRVLYPEEIRGLANPITLQGSWNLAGDGADASAYSRPLATTGPVTWTGGHDGAGGATVAAGGWLTTAGPVLLTDQSYTVSAWVRLTDNGGYRTAVAQQGSHNSAFYLQYDKGKDKWAFAVYSDDAHTTYAKQWSTAPASLGVWTHLAAVYDAGKRQIRLYVNGQLDATTNVTGTYQAGGALIVGQARTNDVLSDQWLGDLDDVRAYEGVLSDAQIVELANQ